jgi:hypothetical protein
VVFANEEHEAGHGLPFSFSGTPGQLNAHVEIDQKNQTVNLVWNGETSDGPAEFSLLVNFYDNDPRRSLGDSRLFRVLPYAVDFTVKYQNPVHFIDWLGDIHMQTNETLYLHPRLPAESGAFPFHWDFQVTNATENISLTVDYVMDGPNVYVGYPNVIGALKSEIRGLISKPISLRGLYSQTFEGVHWRTGERFIFEPGLEEGIDPDILRELRARNIRLLLYTHPGRKATLRALGYDGVLREIAWGTLENQ